MEGVGVSKEGIDLKWEKNWFSIQFAFYLHIISMKVEWILLMEYFNESFIW